MMDDQTRRLGYEVYRSAVLQGALLRPLGNTIYWLPPLITNKCVLSQLQEITVRALMSV
jgi:adenosylmethionine-8-amino-7-oxononanoate aminotransferase